MFYVEIPCVSPPCVKFWLGSVGGCQNKHEVVQWQNDLGPFLSLCFFSNFIGKGCPLTLRSAGLGVSRCPQREGHGRGPALSPRDAPKHGWGLPVGGGELQKRRCSPSFLWESGAGWHLPVVHGDTPQHLQALGLFKLCKIIEVFLIMR